MKLTVVLSGSKSSESQARNALAAAGFAVRDTTHDHGLTPHPEGKMIKTPQSFVTVDADEVDGPAEAVRSLKWQLRLHHETPEPAEPSAEQALEDRLAQMQAQIDALTGGDR